jgi:hypothetical protein
VDGRKLSPLARGERMSPGWRMLTSNRSSDPDHDQRADCDHHGADKRQLFQLNDNGRPRSSPAIADLI